MLLCGEAATLWLRLIGITMITVCAVRTQSPTAGRHTAGQHALENQSEQHMLEEEDVRLAEDGETVILNGEACSITDLLSRTHVVLACGNQHIFVKSAALDEGSQYRKIANRCPDIVRFYGYGPCPKHAIPFGDCLYTEYIQEEDGWRDTMSVSSMASLGVALLRAQSCIFEYTGSYHMDLHVENVLRSKHRWIVIDLDPSFNAGSNAIVAIANPAGKQAMKQGICQLLGMPMSPMLPFSTCDRPRKLQLKAQDDDRWFDGPRDVGTSTSILASLRTIFCGKCTPHGRVYDYNISPCKNGPFLSLDDAVEQLATWACPAHWRAIHSHQICPSGQVDASDEEANRIMAIFSQCVEQDQ